MGLLWISLDFSGKGDWRREWDSNPRYSLKYTRFPSVRLKPLGHLSIRIIGLREIALHKGNTPRRATHEPFRLILSARGRFLYNVSDNTVSWYTHAFKWLPSESPTQRDLKDVVLRMREAGLKETGCNAAIRAINAYLHWAAALSTNAGPDASIHESTN